MLQLLVLAAAAVAQAVGAGDGDTYDHAAVRDIFVDAMNGDYLSSAPTKYLSLFPDGDNAVSWCDPYPACYHGKPNISTFLRAMPKGTDAALLPDPLVTVGSVGGMMTVLSFSFPGESDSCLYTADAHVSWNFSSSSSSSSRSSSTMDRDGAGVLRKAATTTPQLNYVRWVYNASELSRSLRSCLGPSAAGNRGGGGGRATVTGAGERDADLQAVKEYVVGLQYSYADQALICDLLVDSARYCDPYPLDCAYGRNGCRAMKGLPPTAAAAGGAGGGGKGGQCRPGSVRPVYPSGSTTGGMYIAYSAASRTAAGKVSHTLHHTWALYSLAPVNASHRSAAPMLASFDWFMPNHNV